MYITCSQNWEQIGNHFWIKQCIELLMVTADCTMIESSTPLAILPSPLTVITLADPQERVGLSTLLEPSPSDLFETGSVSADSMKGEGDEDMDIEISSTDGDHGHGTQGRHLGMDTATAILLGGIAARRPSTPSDPRQALQGLLSKQSKFLAGLKEMPTLRLLVAISQLCHFDTSLAHETWIQLFPKVIQ